MRLFRKAGDYEAFEQVLAEGLHRYPVELLTYCLMPNHWHLVVRPKTDESLGRWMGWVGVTHVRRHHEHYHSRGMDTCIKGVSRAFPSPRTTTFWRCAATSRPIPCAPGWWNVLSSGSGAGCGGGGTPAANCV